MPSLPDDLPGLLGLWQVRHQDPARWSAGPDLYRLLGERILGLGEPLLAYDVVSDGMELWPADVRLRQLQALALARSGASERANGLLQELRRQGHTDIETLGMLARTFRDLGLMAVDPAQRTAWFRQAAEAYGEAHRKSGDCWPGINLATLLMLLGDREQAAAVARELRARCLKELETPHAGDDRYWLLATLGEAALILGDTDAAETAYRQAAAMAGDRYGNLSATRRNARLLLAELKGTNGTAHAAWGQIEACFRIPPVVVWGGDLTGAASLMDAGGSAPRLEAAVREALRRELDELDTRLGYASATGPFDILFLEALIQRGGQAYLVLPYEPERLFKDRPEIRPGTDWGVRFQRVLDQATEVATASLHGLNEGPVGGEYVGQVLQGLARMRAAHLETGCIGLDLQTAADAAVAGEWQATSYLERWRRLGHDVKVIDLRELVERACPELLARLQQSAPGEPRATASSLSPPPPPAAFARRLMSMLFADAVGFSKLSEEQIPRFVNDFLGLVAELLAATPHAPVVKNTWGDGLHLVFEGVREAGLFALDLCDRITATDWETRGLPRSLGLRIALHAGPVFRCVDPVTGQTSYTGSHVSRAARIEPITPPGQVYASQAFAALACAQGIDEISCEYVGQTPLPKGYGTYPTYHVRRALR